MRAYKQIVNPKKNNTCYKYLQQVYKRNQETTLHFLENDPNKILKIVGPSTQIQNKTLKSSNGGTMSTNESAEDTVKSQLLFDENEQGILQQIYGKDSPLYRIPQMEYTQPMFEFRGYMLAKLLLKPQQIKNVIKIYDVFMSGKNTYIIMEYVKSGVNLQKLTFFQIYQFYKDLIDIIDKFSKIYKSHNFIYRDFKPSNLLIQEINKKKTIRIIDFGQSKLATNNSISTRQSTKLYQPYEYLIAKDGHKLNHLNIDLWSITITLYIYIFYTTPQKGISHTQKDKIIDWTKKIEVGGFKKFKYQMDNYNQFYPSIFDDIFQNVFVPAEKRDIQIIKEIIDKKDRWQNQIKQFQRKPFKKEMFFKSLYYFYNQIINLLKNAFDHFASNINEKNNFKVRLVLYYLRSLIEYMHLTKYKRYQKNKSKVLQITSEEKCVEILVENRYKIQMMSKDLYNSEKCVNYNNIQQLRKNSQGKIRKILDVSSQLGQQALNPEIMKKDISINKLIKKLQKSKGDMQEFEKNLKMYHQKISQKFGASKLIDNQGVDQFLFNFLSIQNIKGSEQRNNFEGHIKKFIIKSYEDNSLNQQLIKTQVRRYIDNWFLEKLYKYCTAINQQEQNESEMNQEIPSMESILQLSQEKMKAEEQDEAGFLGDKWRFSEIWNYFSRHNQKQII